MQYFSRIDDFISDENLPEDVVQRVADLDDDKVYRIYRGGNWRSKYLFLMVEPEDDGMFITRAYSGEHCLKEYRANNPLDAEAKFPTNLRG